ncbi:MAG TPA: membrane protein insertase YidC, partial [candidate division WWE3 bacterium]|nr:membrane protein insertase YidC [candidate division WWE3 bacterium]
LKKKYKNNKTLLSKKQMELYKKHGINPASGCLPNIVQILILIALYRVFISILNNDLNVSFFYFDFLKNAKLSTEFFIWDLAKPDKFYILPVLAALVQFLTSKLMAPAVKASEKIAKKTESSQDDLMVSMQQNMVYMTPVMTLIIGAKLPSGLILYWFVSSLFSFIQTYLLKKYVYSAKK